MLSAACACVVDVAHELHEQERWSATDAPPVRSTLLGSLDAEVWKHSGRPRRFQAILAT